MKFELKMHLINCTLAADIEGHTINLTIEFKFLHRVNKCIETGLPICCIIVNKKLFLLCSIL